MLLYGLGEFDAFRQIPVLHQFEDDVAFGSVRVEALIFGLVVALVRDNAVFAFGHFKVFCGTVHTECVGLGTDYNILSGSHRVGMDADEEVGLCLVGNVGTFL